MSGVKRVFVEKKKPFAVNAKELLEEIGGYLGIKTITDVRVLIRYDIENLSEETYKKALTTVFSEPPVDDVYEGTFPVGKDDFVFSVEYLPGQFDQRADSAEQCVKFFNENETPVIKTAVTYVLTGTVTDEEKNRIKEHCINPVDSRQAAEDIPETLVTEFKTPADVIYFDGFKDMPEDKLKELYDSLGLAMTFKDFKFIQEHFASVEKRDPSMTEIRVLDTYWSDHSVTQHLQQSLQMLSLRTDSTKPLWKLHITSIFQTEQKYIRTVRTSSYALWTLHLWVLRS